MPWVLVGVWSMRVFGLFYRGEGREPDLGCVEWFGSMAAAGREFRRRVRGEVSEFRWLDRDDDARHEVLTTWDATLVLYEQPPQLIKRRGTWRVEPDALGRYLIGDQGGVVYERHRPARPGPGTGPAHS